MSAKIIDGKKIAVEIRKDVFKEILKLKSIKKIQPNIVSVKIGDDPSSNL